MSLRPELGRNPLQCMNTEDGWWRRITPPPGQPDHAWIVPKLWRHARLTVITSCFSNRSGRATCSSCIFQVVPQCDCMVCKHGRKPEVAAAAAGPCLALCADYTCGRPLSILSGVIGKLRTRTPQA